MASISTDRTPWWRRARSDALSGWRPELWWWLWVGANAWAIMHFSDWATVPFHFIWIGLALMYGWRVWSVQVTVASLTLVVLGTGVTLAVDVLRGNQASDELTEIPLMSAVFIVMVIYVRRAAAVQKETERISQHNHALLAQNRRLVQNASHNLRTPLTIALGYAEVLQRTTTDGRAADDAAVVIDELHRLKKTTDRLLQLAKSDQPDYLFRVEASTAELMQDVVSRWTVTHPEVRVGALLDEVIMLDRDRTVEALDELISNAVHHGDVGTTVEVSSRNEDGYHVLSVADTGPGIPSSQATTVFDRFSRLSLDDHDGIGIGLAIVKAVAEAHGGRVRLETEQGHGSRFEIMLPRRIDPDANLGVEYSEVVPG